MRKLVAVTLSVLLTSVGWVGMAQAVPVDLNSLGNCNGGTAVNGIAVGDVTGNAGGASNCFGTVNGNDPGPSGDGFSMGTMQFDYAAKVDLPALSNQGITLNQGGKSGTWAYNAGGVDFLIVLKAANSPGYAAWLFTGTDAASTSGTWKVAWNKDLSHLSVYEKVGTPPNVTPPNVTPPNVTPPIPEPATILLFGTGLAGLGLWRLGRKQK